MKRLLLIIILLGIIIPVFAQSNTNPWPSSGSVGIGTTTPQAKLHVVGGEIRLTGAGTSGPASSAIISFYDSNNTTRYGFLGDASAGNTDIYLNADAGGSLRFGTNGVNDQLIVNTLGNVGIGDTNPLYKLTVNAQNNTGSAAVLFHGRYYGMSVSSEQSTSAYYALNVLGGTSSSGGGGSSLLFVRTDGNVGIGTVTPDQKLSVNGAIHSQSVLVDLTGWPDYVFKAEYQLPSLAYVRDYISQNKHLPDMPSDAEVTRDGLNLGEINKLLTKKVEELTLYLIERDSIEKQQQHELLLQDDRIKKLEATLNQLLKNK